MQIQGPDKGYKVLGRGFGVQCVPMNSQMMRLTRIRGLFVQAGGPH